MGLQPAYLLVALPGGRLVDRASRPAAVMRTAFLGAALAAALSGALAVTGRAGLASLGGLALLIGAARVVTAAAVTRLVPVVVPPAAVARANAALVAAYALAAVLGPAAAALLVGVVGPARTLLLEASALLIGAVLVPAGVRVGAAPAGPGLLVSLPWRAVRPLVANALSNAAYAGLFAVLVWEVTGRMGLAPWAYGAMVGCFGVGSTAGALAAPRLRRGRPDQQALVLATLLMTITPDHLRGRLGGLVDLVTQGVKPIGAVGAGLLADRCGLPQALVAALGVTLLALLVQAARRHPEITRTR